MSLYRDRRHAGRVLAAMLQPYASRSDLLVLALPRGGVPVAYEVAQALEAPLDVFVVRKLGVPGQPELAMGALASGGTRVLQGAVIELLGISPDDVELAVLREERELLRRERIYRRGRPALDVAGRTVILVDDGLATGATMRAAIRALRRQQPARIVSAVPVAAPETCAAISEDADEAVCAATPRDFHAVGLWYEDFSQTSDEEVRALLDAARRAREPRAAAHTGASEVARGEPGP
jgi:predicted phosphoribosyltransferase